MKKRAGTWFGEKVKADGYTFDSKKEYDFYRKFIKDCGYRFEVHPNFSLHDTFKVVGRDINIRSSRYTPDFVIYDSDNSIKHVYDLKNSFTSYAIDQAAALRFKWFAWRYGIPVEVVVPRAHDFKIKILGITKRFNPVTRLDVDYDLDEMIEEALSKKKEDENGEG